MNISKLFILSSLCILVAGHVPIDKEEIQKKSQYLDYLSLDMDETRVLSKSS